jgi:hypothetical protein
MEEVVLDWKPEVKASAIWKEKGWFQKEWG